MTTLNYTKNTIVQGDKKIEFESRPEFGLENKKGDPLKPPRIEMFKHLRKAVVTNNKKTLNTLLQVLECAGWKWPGGEPPTDTKRLPQLNEQYKPGMCITFNEPSERYNYFYISCAIEKTYRNKGKQILQPYEYYYNKLGFDTNTLGKVKKYFIDKEKLEKK